VKNILFVLGLVAILGCPLPKKPIGPPVEPVEPHIVEPTTPPSKFLEPQALLDDDIMVGVNGDMGATRFDLVVAAVRKYQADLPEDWADETRLTTPSLIDRAFEQISARLPVRAAQSWSMKRSQKSDALFVLREDGIKFEEWHLFNYKTGEWANGVGAMKGVWTLSGTSEPTVVSSCPPPIPLRAYEEDGSAHWFLKCKPHVPAWVIDCTPKVYGQPDYCEAVHGKRDLNCDIRPEGAADRPVCEASLYGSIVVESRNGAECGQYGGNPMQFSANGGNCRICSTNKPLVCSDWF
jgi:hypothetical protein